MVRRRAIKKAGCRLREQPANLEETGLRPSSTPHPLLHRTTLEPRGDLLAFLVGHMGHVAERHRLERDGLLVDALRVRRNFFRRIEQHPGGALPIIVGCAE